MEEFTASNFIRIREGEWGHYEYAVRNGMEFTEVGRYAAGSPLDHALAEYYRAKEDERLGRWRSTENPGWLVTIKPDNDGDHIIWNEANPTDHSYAGRLCGEPDDENDRKAFNEFKRSTTPPAWHDAKPGEVWVVDISDLATWEGEQPMIVNRDGEFQNRVWIFPVTDPDIISARKIYPAE